MVSKDGGLARYLREVSELPCLEKGEEQRLALRLRDHGDLNAANKLATSHLKLVSKIAMKYKSNGVAMADLISEGNIGLMKAISKFDPDRDLRLSTYAMWWIRAAIFDYIRHSWSMVKVSTASSQKKLFFSLRRLKARLNIMDNGNLSLEQAEQLSQAANVPVNDIIKMNQRLSSRDFSLNVPVSHEEDADDFQGLLADKKPSQEMLLGDRQEMDLRSKILASAIDDLPERERHIFTARRLQDDRPTLEQLGLHHGITRERVRQIEVQVFDRIKKMITENNPADAAKSSMMVLAAISGAA
jgi:RNA polymerase sigma-32 factor